MSALSMTSRLHHITRLLAGVSTACLLLAGNPAGADDRSVQAVKQAVAGLTASPGTARFIAARAEVLRRIAGLMPRDALVDIADPAKMNVPGVATLEEADLRLALIQLAMGSGTNDQVSLIRSQVDQEKPRVLILQGGRMTLAQLGAAAAKAGLKGLKRDADGWVLTQPLVIWQDGGLDLSPGEHLTMSGQSGAFLLSFGDLRMTGAEVSGDLGINKSATGFRPFVLVAGAGTLMINQSTISGLGFGRGSNFGGVVV
ncbi:MAG: hypothetical protein ABI459_06330, partial [Deltaproteobacteria bacterium]